MKNKHSLPVIFEDEFLFAVNKPPRMACVPAPGISLGQTLVGIIKEQFASSGFSPYLLHRLDSDTSGVVLFGKHEEHRADLENIFRDKEGTKKIYVALVKGIPRGGVMKMKLKARHTDIAVDAETRFKVLEVFPLRGLGEIPCAFVEVEILTGRKHQIRQHFSTIGCPVVMDVMYGDEKFNSRFFKKYHLSRQFLHAATLSFIHPVTGKRLTIETKLPPDLMSCLKKIA